MPTPVVNCRPWVDQYQLNDQQTGETGAWTSAGDLPVALSDFELVVTKNKVYVLGGTLANGTTVATVYSAPIVDGVIGTWTEEVSNPLPGPISDFSCAITRGRIYTFGGWNGTASISTIYTAPIDANGVIGAWATSAITGRRGTETRTVVTRNIVLLYPRYYPEGTSINPFIYRFVIASDGTLGTGVELNSPAVIATAATLTFTNDTIFQFGGLDSNRWQIVSSGKAPIDASGSIGTWAFHPSLPDYRAYMGHVTTAARMFLFGGRNLSNVDVNTIWSAPIVDGVPGAWAESATPLPHAVAKAGFLVTSSRLYMIGGQNGTTRLSSIHYTAFAGGFDDYTDLHSQPPIEADGDAVAPVPLIEGQLAFPIYIDGDVNQPLPVISGITRLDAYFDITPPTPEISGSAIVGILAHGDFVSPRAVYSGTTGANGDIDQPLPDIQGVAVVGIVAHGEIACKPPDVSGLAALGIVADGDFDAGMPKIDGSIDHESEEPVNTGAISQPLPTISASAVVGIVASGNFDSPRGSVEAVAVIPEELYEIKFRRCQYI